MFNLNFDWNMQTILFFFFAVCIISGAVLMINFTKVVHMVVSLAFAFIGLAGIYIMLEAEFLAFVQVLVYAGAISILMIFGIMMTRHDKQEETSMKPWKEALTAIGCLALFSVLFLAIRGTSFPTPAEKSLATDNTMELGKLIFTEQVLPFELLSVLLTVAFIGAIVLAKHDESPSDPGPSSPSLVDKDSITTMLRQSIPTDHSASESATSSMKAEDDGASGQSAPTANLTGEGDAR